MALGWIYVLSNPAMPGLVKIGQSSSDPELRGDALFTTGVPEPFSVAYKGLYEDYARLERLVHLELAEMRHRAEREFFRLGVQSAVMAIRKVSQTDAKYEAWLEKPGEGSVVADPEWTPMGPRGRSPGQIERDRRRLRYPT